MSEPQPIKYLCGCVNVIDPWWGVQRSVTKCEGHKAHAGKSGLAYYAEMGAIDGNGYPQHTRYARELLTGLAEAGHALIFDHSPKIGPALEIGAGLGMYCPLLLTLGYPYMAIEPAADAALWIESVFGVTVQRCNWEQYALVNNNGRKGWGLIVAAHVIEHLVDAPEGIRKMFDALVAGGRLVIVIPDDEDPLNPDHLWFFTAAHLENVLTRIGFKDIKTSVKKIVSHESFIYCTAVKP